MLEILQRIEDRQIRIEFLLTCEIAAGRSKTRGRARQLGAGSISCRQQAHGRQDGQDDN
jgi:hypothetical protein